MSDFLKKNGLLYTDDFKTLVGVDSESGDFKGRVPFGPKQISDKAFAGVNYESISLPDSVKAVGFNLFENAAGVKSIKLPSALSELTPYMFAGCASLEKVNMPNIVAEFPEHIFEGCASLKEVPFRTDIVYIGASACEKCTGITSLAFPETVQTVESRAFADCTSLESVVIGANVFEIAEDAFSGCAAINRIRLDETNENFYIGEDGSLYRKSDDKLIIENCPKEKQSVSFFSSAVAEDEQGDNPLNNPVWIDEVDEDEDDDTFSAEIGADGDEETAFGIDKSSEIEQTIEMKNDIGTQSIQGEENMEQDNDVLASIMDQNTSTESVDSSVAVNIDEIAGVVSAMNDTNGIYTEDQAKAKKQEKNISILCNSVEYSYIKDFEPAGVPVTNPTLYVIAEKLVTTSSGNATVSNKLMSCCESLVKIHNFNRVVFFSGLPLENDEFVMFLTNMLSLQNVLVACEAASPANLSDYCKQVCEIAGVSLEKTEMAEQQKLANVNEPTVLKLIVQDKY